VYWLGDRAGEGWPLFKMDWESETQSTVVEDTNGRPYAIVGDEIVYITASKASIARAPR
jgi:hypothetical protein